MMRGIMHPGAMERNKRPKRDMSSYIGPSEGFQLGSMNRNKPTIGGMKQSSTVNSPIRKKRSSIFGF